VRGEARQNAIAIAIGFGIVALVGLFVLRPALVLGVSEGALASSVQGEVDIGSYEGRSGTPCTERVDGSYRCGLVQSSDQRSAVIVEVGRFGCWQATPVAGSSSKRELDGCIWLLDY
jgi:hypothetical protein